MQLHELLRDHQLYHSEFQQDYIITLRAGGPTVYGQYKQALRELFKRYRGLKELYTSRELLQIDIEELEQKETTDRFENRRNQVRLAQKRMGMEDLEKNIQDTEREFKRFYQQATALKAQIGDLTDERRSQLDREMWQAKMQEMAAIDLQTIGRLSNNTYEMIGASPPEIRDPVLKMCANASKLIDWFENKANSPLIELQQDVDVKTLMDGQEAPK
jgi:chromosome segregation ATPase